MSPHPLHGQKQMVKSHCLIPINPVRDTIYEDKSTRDVGKSCTEATCPWISFRIPVGTVAYDRYQKPKEEEWYKQA